MQLTGLHHLTAVTARAADNAAFYTRALGLRLVKKTVNQDDVSAYHLFYADGLASPGSDITFFDWPAPPERRGANSISRTGLRVAGGLDWWRDHLAREGVRVAEPAMRDGRLTLDFEDPEGQRLSLVDDGGEGEAHPWAKSSVPAERQIRGLGPVRLSVAAPERTEAVLTDVLGMRFERGFDTPEGEVRVFAMGEGGPAAEVQVLKDASTPAGQGAGGVHHVAFRIPDVDYSAWADRLKSRRMPTSGPVDRYYFRSLYFREPNGILFEIATDGPGFTADEPLETLGQGLALPPFLESRRAEIEAGLKPL
ncbi:MULTISPECIES: ring-cleaving dioxygenase [Methylobacterium]|uniref:Ring-cleaving dioxygenase MhqA n=1 Tax=Methylobacterium thuringiense TaxID=1003091 RepID=A0ABQ4TNB1_9HYPH|nr:MULTISPECIES: ring-cleaving dioxygenase [Methylobacterium]TXN22462.1 ring-cleaving dioxygenase [Methylobacterium sp. WL9]GJE56471.1 Putative ring-cleaving dioxygenase MhqA [Methylobacterium thuringiense]